jgi:tetratricopeptide (TPR) repeat protein
MLRVLITVYLILFLGSNGYGQRQAIIDSLLIVLPEMKEDTNKVNLLKKLSFMYSEVNTNEGIKYGEQGLALARKLNWKPGMSKNLNNIAMNYVIRADYTKALEYYFSALKINEELDNKSGQAINLSQIGVVYYRQGNPAKASEYYFRSLEISEQLNDKSNIAGTLGNIGLIHSDQGNYDSAIVYISKALVLYEELKKVEDIGVFTGNLGNAYLGQKNYAEATRCFEKGLKIATEIGNRKSAAYNLKNLAVVNISQRKNLHQAIQLLDTALSIFASLKMLYDVQVCYLQLSDAHKLSGNYKASLEAYEQYALYKDSVFNGIFVKNILFIRF